MGDLPFCRRLNALGHSIDLSTDDAPLAEQIERLFVDVPAGGGSGPTVEICVTRVDEERFDLSGPTPWSGSVEEREVLPRLMTAVNRLVLDLTDSALCLHAAGFESDHVVHGLIGASGVGKTTLLVELLRRGLTALNDEMLCIERDSMRVESWAKPLSVKPGPYENAVAEAEPGLQRQQFRSVPLSQVGAYTTSPGALRSMIFLERGGTGKPPCATQCSPADAMVALGDHVMNFRAVGARESLTTMAAAVSTCSTWTLGLADPSGTAEFLIAEVEGAEPNSVEWSLVDRADSPAVAGCITSRLGDEVVVWSPESENLVALGQAAAALWVDLTEGSPDALLMHIDFTRSLVDHGLLNTDDVLERRRSRGR